MPQPKTKPLPDWDPAGPKGTVRPRTFDQKVADDLRELRKMDDDRKKWEKESDRIHKEQEARRKAHETQWMELRSRCAASLGILSNQIKIRKNNWSNVAIDVSTAYKSAFDSFSGLLKEESTHSEAFWNKAFTALSSCVTGGISTLVKKQGEKWAKDESQKLFIESAEKAVNAGVGALFTATAPLAASKYEATSIPSPDNLRSELEKLLNNLESDMLAWCIAQQELIKNMHLWQFEYYDPQKLDEEIAKFLQEKDSQFNSQPFPLQGTKVDLATELEKMMIGPWAAAFCQKQLDRWVIHSRLPQGVIARLVAFGFVSDAGHYSDADVLRHADWGRNTERVMRRTIDKIGSYRSKKFG